MTTPSVPAELGDMLRYTLAQTSALDFDHEGTTLPCVVATLIMEGLIPGRSTSVPSTGELLSEA